MANIIDFGAASSGLLNVAIVLSILVISLLLVWAVFTFVNYQKRYREFTIVIWEKDGFGQFRQTHDKGGIFVDKKTNDKRLYLKKNKVGLECNNIPYIPTGDGKKMVYLLKVGSKNYTYIKPNVKSDLSFTLGEEDVNWGLQAYQKQKANFGTNSLLQWLPYISLIIVSVIILIIFVYFFKNFEVLKDVAIAFEKAATELAKYHGNTYNSTMIIQ